MLNLSRSEMAELDRIAVEMLGVTRLMELAGLHAAQLALKVAAGRRAIVLAGHGNNGGDGLCCARHLANFGFSVRVLLAREELTEHCAAQRAILERMGIPCEVFAGERLEADLLIDALLGFNARGNARAPYDSLISAANASGIPILSIDLPSGLDADTGAGVPCIRATWTLALSAVKKGCTLERERVGMLFAAYLGVSAGAYEKIGKKAPAYAGDIEKIYL